MCELVVICSLVRTVSINKQISAHHIDDNFFIKYAEAQRKISISRLNLFGHHSRVNFPGDDRGQKFMGQIGYITHKSALHA